MIFDKSFRFTKSEGLGPLMFVSSSSITVPERKIRENLALFLAREGFIQGK